MAKYKECEKAVKAAAFAAAIQTEETMPLSETINLDKFGAWRGRVYDLSVLAQRPQTVLTRRPSLSYAMQWWRRRTMARGWRRTKAGRRW